MPATGIENVVGKKCIECDGPATHLYGNIYLCCDCHAGQNQGLYTRAEAEALHAKHSVPTKNLCAYRVRGGCDDCDADHPIADYPAYSGGAQPKGVAERMVDIWQKQHEATTGHAKGHIKVIREPEFYGDSGQEQIVRPGEGSKEG